MSSIAAIVASLPLALVPAGTAHPSHVTLAQAEYNDETASLEVALRINPFDLEDVLSERAGRRVNLDTTEDADALIAEYLGAAFVVEPAGGSPVVLEWVGKEVFVHTAWLYFEYPLPDGPEDVFVTNRLLFERQDDQVNTINFRRGAHLKSVRHTLAEPRHALPTG